MKKIERRIAPNQVGFDYPTMSVEEIAKISLPKYKDCFVFVWTTQKFLLHTFDILKLWGLKYRFTMTWIKNGGFQVYNYPQFNSEFVVLATCGNPEFIDTKDFFTAFYAKRRGHSVKPQEFYDLIVRVTPAPRIDMFSRRQIKGFDVWGNEV